MPTLGDLIVRVGVNAEQFTSGMGAVNSKLRDLDRQISTSTDGFDKMAGRLSNIGSSLTSLGAGLTATITAPLAGVGVAALKVAGDMEQAKVAFTTFLGSAEKAGAFLNQLRDFALKTPFELPGLIQASQRLMAMGFAAEKTLPILRNIGDAVAAVGGSGETLNRVVTAFGQIQAKGRLMAEEMRQLAEAGIPAWSMLAKALGTDVAGAMKMVEARAVSADVAIRALSEGIEKNFGGMMERQAKTLAGMWSNFKDQITKTLDSIGQALLPIGKRILEMAANVLQGVSNMAAAFSALPQPIQLSIVALAGLAAATGPVLMAFGALASGAGALLQTWTRLAPMFGGMTGSLGLLTNAFAVLLPVIAGVSTAMGLLNFARTAAEIVQTNDVFRSMIQVLGLLLDQIEAVVPKFEGLRSAVSGFFQRMRQEAQTFEWSDLVPGKFLIDQATKELDRLGSVLSDKTVLIADKVKTSVNTTMRTAVDTIAAQIKKAVDEAAKGADTLAGAFDKLGIESTGNLKKKAEELRTAYATVVQAFKDGRATADDVRRAHDALSESLKKLSGNSDKAAEAAKRHERAYFEMLDRYDKMVADYIASAEKLNRLTKEVEDSQTHLALEFGKAHQRMREETQKTVSIVVPLYERLPQSVVNVIRQTEELSEAMKDLGVSHRQSADEAVAAFEKIRVAHEQGKVSSAQYLEAERNMLRTVRDEAKANGEAMNADQAARLAQLEGMLGSHAEKQKGIWQTIGNQISTVFTDLSRQLANLIIEGGNFGQVMIGIVKSFAEAIIRQLIEGALAQLSKKLLEVSGLFGSLFGTGASAAAGAAASAGGSAAAGAAGTAAGAGIAAGAAQGILGAVGAVGAAVSAVMDVLGYFQGRRMEKDIGRIEVTTRGILAECLNRRADAWEQFNQMFTRLGEIWTDVMGIRQVVFERIASKLDEMAVALSESLGRVATRIGDSVTGSAEGFDALAAKFDAFMEKVAAPVAPTAQTVNLAAASGGGVVVYIQGNTIMDSEDATKLAKLMTKALEDRGLL